MTSPATQEPCPICACSDGYHLASCPNNAPPSQRAELLTQELESAMAKLRKSAAAEQNHRLSEAEAAALLQHIAALTQRVEAADKLASVAIHNHSLFYCGKGKCGICNALEAYRALSQEPR